MGFLEDGNDFVLDQHHHEEVITVPPIFSASPPRQLHERQIPSKQVDTAKRTTSSRNSSPTVSPKRTIPAPKQPTNTGKQRVSHVLYASRVCKFCFNDKLNSPHRLQTATIADQAHQLLILRRPVQRTPKFKNHLVPFLLVRETHHQRKTSS